MAMRENVLVDLADDCSDVRVFPLAQTSSAPKNRISVQLFSCLLHSQKLECRV